MVDYPYVECVPVLPGVNRLDAFVIRNPDTEDDEALRLENRQMRACLYLSEMERGRSNNRAPSFLRQVIISTWRSKCTQRNSNE